MVIVVFLLAIILVVTLVMVIYWTYYGCPTIIFDIYVTLHCTPTDPIEQTG